MNTYPFEKGIYKLNNEANFDFQLNRVIMWDGGDLEDVQEVAPRIVDSASWKRELICLGDKAISEGRIQQSIAYYRMSEFFMYDGDPDKKKYYLLATEMFYSYYSKYFASGEVVRHSVPYEDCTLPVMVCKAKGERKGKILLHGGNDSYFEELFFPMLYFAEHGYDCYLFEGPGQGGVLRIEGKHFIHEWERPVHSILDYFALDKVYIIGASLGGMLAPRAAAFEERIVGVIAWSVFPSFLEVILDKLPRTMASIVRFLLRHHGGILLKPILGLIQLAGKNSPMFVWGVKHGMYAYEANSLYDYVKKMSSYQMMDIADRVTQDILILGASEDHFINYKMVGEEIAALVNVHSLTFRLFTDKEMAGNHCNVGNTQLTLDVMIRWLDEMRKE